MKTFLQTVHSLPHLVHHSNVSLKNRYINGVNALLNTQLQEEGNSLIVSVPVPGMTKEDLDVYMEDRTLVISTKGQGKLHEHPMGLKHRDLKYSFVLPAGIDTDRIQAKCRNGLLTIKIDKIENKKRHNVIKVLGQESVGKDGGRLNILWDKIKTKLDVRRIVALRPIKYS